MNMKKKGFHRGTSFLLSFLLLFTLFSFHVEAAPKSDEDTIRVGWYEDSYHITGTNGERSGYGYEYEQSLASYTGWNYKYIKDDWSKLIEMLQSGKIDLMGGISYTDKRAETMLFSDLPMGTEKYYLYADLANSDISASDLTSLNGKRIVLLENSVQATQFCEWEKEHNIQTEHVYLDNVDDAMKMADNHEVNGVISTETPIWVNYGMSAITTTGESGIYYCISKKRPDLKDKLDIAMRKMENDNPFYGDDLYKKYLSAASAPVLSCEEADWLKQHGEVKMGYVKNDPGFSSIDEISGKPIGVINDYIKFASGCFEKQALQFELIGFDSQEEEIQALKENRIDMIFHVSQNPYAAEKNGFILSTTVLEVPLAAVSIQNSFNENDENTIAIEKGDLFLKWHISYNYPKWKIVEYNSTKDVEKAVKNGQADCFLVKSGMVTKYIENNKYNCVFLTDPGNTSFAVGRNSTDLMAILNKTLQAMQSSMLTGALSMYDNASNKVTLTDFIKDNLLVVASVFTLLFLLILFVILQLLRKARVAEEKAKEAQSQAENANAAKSTFLFNMSHDIRTPMNALLGYNQLMKKELTDSKLLDYQEKIEQAGNLLLSIINNVLDMARIESGKMELDENYSKVGDILKDVCEVFDVEAKKKGIRLTYETQVMHKHILCDVTNVQKILMNLVSNAVKYTPSGGTITIKSQELPCDKEGYTRIKTEVVDNGIGISKEYLPLMFDSFSRERNTTIGKIGGTGLGMSIVKKLVDMMGGSIAVESELGKGSRFTLILEQRIADENYYEQKTEETSADGKEILQGKRILLAEDNELNAEIAIAILEDMGLKVERVEDGVQCISQIEKMPAGSYDVILMDIQMPHMDGYKATETIRSLPDQEKANIPIVAMTANAFEEDRKTAFDKGMNEHIAKPIDVEKVEKVLLAILK